MGGFGNEMKDFLAAFEVGSNIVGKYADRKLAKQKEANDLTIATNKAQSDAIKQQRLTNQWEMNQQRLQGVSDEQKRQFEITSGRLGEVAKANQENVNLDNARADAAQKRLDAINARNDRAARMKEDPVTGILNDTGSGVNVTDNAPPEQVSPDATPVQGVDLTGGNTTAAPGATGGKTKTPGTDAIPMSNNPVELVRALHGGLTYLQDHFGLKAPGGVDTGQPPNPDGVKRMLQGEGTRTPEEMKKIDELTKTDGVPEQMRSTARLWKAYNAMLAKDDVKGADQMAASIIQTARGAAAMAGYHAEDLYRKGDIKGATEALLKGYNQIPDGYSVTVDHKTNTFKKIDDMSGKVVEEGAFKPEDIFALSTGMKNGSLVWKVLLDRAANDPSNKPAAGELGAQAKLGAAAIKADAGPSTGSPSAAEQDRQSLSDTSNPIHQASQDAMDKTLLQMPGPDGQPLLAGKSPEQITAMITPKAKDALNQLTAVIALHNNLPVDRAASLALMTSEPSDQAVKGNVGSYGPGGVGDVRWNFQLREGSDDRVMKFRAADGTPLEIPATAAPLIMAANNDLLKLQTAAMADHQANMQAQADAAHNEQIAGVQIERNRQANIGGPNYMPNPPMPPPGPFRGRAGNVPLR